MSSCTEGLGPKATTAHDTSLRRALAPHHPQFGNKRVVSSILGVGPSLCGVGGLLCQPSTRLCSPQQPSTRLQNRPKPSTTHSPTLNAFICCWSVLPVSRIPLGINKQLPNKGDSRISGPWTQGYPVDVASTGDVHRSRAPPCEASINFTRNGRLAAHSSTLLSSCTICVSVCVLTHSAHLRLCWVVDTGPAFCLCGANHQE
jgi:hypothetical protein|mmetsp:Transcript_81863/g.136844  ORF Transcript_81863/g.136844 Transcript_81863/m.136844 type:complete len:202 (-) Transcript_81863:1401-2006(-)